jgi:uncharacterized protein
MSLPRDLKDYVVFSDGVQIGECESGQAPKLSYKVEEWIGGGMAGPVEIDQHLEKLGCEWATRGFSIPAFKQFGHRRLGAIGLRFVGAFQRADTSAVDSVEHIMRGTHREIDGGDMKRGDNGNTKVMSSLTIYEMRINDEEVIHIDLINGVERYNGIDVRADIRQALGV